MNTVLHKAFSKKTVLVSGHTGFKGAWLCQWLLDMGAKVHGLSLEPPTQPSLFEQLRLACRMEHQICDVRDSSGVSRLIGDAQPDFVFHLAAQAIVRKSFVQPVETYTANVLGTINILEALRKLQHQCVGVMVTTDKCYLNREFVHGYREEDALGGHDPYSSSKAAAEIAIASWRRSFFLNHPVQIASARAGNVIGGADWASDRIVPDCVRSLQNGQPIPVRNRLSTRPWQHVLEPLSGYLWLAAVLANPSFRPFGREVLESAFNFGPSVESNRTVAELVQEILKHWPGTWADKSDPNAVHEASLLNLSTDKAYHLLAWKPVWNFEKAIEATIGWYRTVSGSSDKRASEVTSAQIIEYQDDAAAGGLPWAKCA